MNLQQIKDSLSRVAESSGRKTTCQLSPKSCQMLLEALPSHKHLTCNVCGLIRYSENERLLVSATDKFCTCPNSAVKSKLSSTLRKHLEWAWNYAIAEGYREYTTKEIARDIADGVVRGEDAEDEALLEDFARNYCEDDSGKNPIDGEWKPELESDQVELEKLLVPICNQLREEGEF